MFLDLIAKVRRVQTELDYKLATTFDPYRLQNLLHNHIDTLSNLHRDALSMVKELEEL